MVVLKVPFLPTGGFQAFEHAYPELCEDALMRTRDEVVDTHLPSYDSYNNCVGVGMGVGGMPSSPGNEAAIEQAQASEVLPFLYIGNARDAQDLRVLQVSLSVRLRGGAKGGDWLVGITFVET